MNSLPRTWTVPTFEGLSLDRWKSLLSVDGLLNSDRSRDSNLITLRPSWSIAACIPLHNGRSQTYPICTYIIYRLIMMIETINFLPYTKKWQWIQKAQCSYHHVRTLLDTHITNKGKVSNKIEESIMLRASTIHFIHIFLHRLSVLTLYEQGHILLTNIYQPNFRIYYGHDRACLTLVMQKYEALLKSH